MSSTDATLAGHWPGPGGDRPRPRRADAARNVLAVLDAAKVVFARSGVDAPAKEITDLAGVGVGTLYRHFPHRSDLVIAVLEEEIQACAQAATDLLGAHDAWLALTQWVGILRALVGTKRGLALALHSSDRALQDLPRRIMDVLEPAAETLLVAARASGDVRADLTSRDLILAVALMCQPVAGQDLGFNDRMIHVFVEGLRQAQPPTGS